MSLTFTAARSEVYSRFDTEWAANSGAVVGSVPDIRWMHVEERSDADADEETPEGDYWTRVSMVHVVGNQASLSGALGTQRWERNGLVTVQVFQRQSLGGGLDILDQLAKIVADMFEGYSTPGGVWFRDVTPQEIPPKRGWRQVNILATFQYDEVK
jgi:hypothetical protein